MKLVVRYSGKQVEILENNTPFLENGKIPDKFMEYIKHISNLTCESLSFKWHYKEFYNIELSQIAEEFHFKIKKIESFSIC